ncbi:MAG: UDP-N-acetylmuramoyl-L-alanyl-D-glutamate--2,6-diaminopimelate ligase [Candidatus Aminicenantes bacterium]|nr:UDP-N-acetylmuramoyl-L-alanyl-D-glutamate--2,6-diaminopimelate ligase [Candidatus Aminicenantes bacterium]
MNLTDILEAVPVINLSGDTDIDIRGITYSSKSVQPGFLFAAMKGEKTDGMNFVADSLERGALAVLSDREAPENFPKTWIQACNARLALGLCSANFYSHPSEEIPVIGVTGTKGKTTVTYILEAILKKANFRPGVLGTISYRGPKREIPAPRTTPEAPDLQRMLREMIQDGASHCVMEVSSHSLALQRVTGIRFQLTVFTNLSGEHMDYHHSMEDYFEAKKRLFSLPGKKHLAVVNTDDSWGKKLASQLTMGVISFGVAPPAMVRAEQFRFSEKGIEADIKYPAGRISLQSPLLGRPNLYNILAATASALILNIPVHKIKEGIASLRGVPGRFEKIENPFGFNLMVDYAHTDDALRKLLETTRELSKQRIILVFGAGGDRDKTKRPRMGEVAASYADWMIITSDNPRSEDPLTIISQIEEGIKKTGSTKYSVQPDRKKAIREALRLAKRDDYVLVAGKGHENYQIVGDEVHTFDDADVIREIIKELEG